MSTADTAGVPRVTLREVGLRDALQLIERPVPTAFKCDWILLAYAAGLRRMDVGCFGRDVGLPQMADTAEVVAFATTLPDLEVCVQVRDVEGAARAFDAGVAMVTLPVPASPRYGRASLGRDAAQMLRELRAVHALRAARGVATRLEAGVSTAFGCLRLGPVPTDAVLALVREAVDGGADQVGLADTFAQATPQAVGELFTRARAAAGGKPLCAHLHADDESGQAAVQAALEAGVRHFDVALAGMGGNRLVGGVHGNASLESVAAWLHGRGLETGVEGQVLCELRRFAGTQPDALALFNAVARAAPILSTCLDAAGTCPCAPRLPFSSATTSPAACAACRARRRAARLPAEADPVHTQDCRRHTCLTCSRTPWA